MDQCQEELYITDNIIIGMGEVPGRRGKEGVVWFLPGGQSTSSRFKAISTAFELDRLIQYQVSKRAKPYNRR